MASIDEGFPPRQDGALPLADGDSDGARVFIRQHTMLTDLQEAVAIGVDTLDFAFEGEFDPVEDSLAPEGETTFEKSKALHKIALAGIEPIITAARAAASPFTPLRLSSRPKRRRISSPKESVLARDTDERMISAAAVVAKLCTRRTGPHIGTLRDHPIHDFVENVDGARWTFD